jgi:hypothetical protein
LAYADATSIERLVGMAQLFGSTRIQSCGSFGAIELEADVTDRFADTCDRLGPDIQLSTVREFLTTNGHTSFKFR